MLLFNVFILSVISFKDELIVCLADGWLHRLSWAGDVLQNLSFNIRSITAQGQHHGNIPPKSLCFQIWTITLVIIDGFRLIMNE